MLAEWVRFRDDEDEELGMGGASRVVVEEDDVASGGWDGWEGGGSS